MRKIEKERVLMEPNFFPSILFHVLDAFLVLTKKKSGREAISSIQYTPLKEREREKESQRTDHLTSFSFLRRWQNIIRCIELYLYQQPQQSSLGKFSPYSQGVLREGTYHFQTAMLSFVGIISNPFLDGWDGSCRRREGRMRLQEAEAKKKKKKKEAFWW